MTPRTSQSSPLRVDRLPLDRGVIGMTICPGKKGPSTMGDAWDRDMRTDMLHLKDEGVSTIVTLMEWDELGIYKAQSVKREAAKLGIQWLFFPFPLLFKDEQPFLYNFKWELVTHSILGSLLMELLQYYKILMLKIGLKIKILLY